MRHLGFSLVVVIALASCFLARADSNPTAKACPDRPGRPLLAVPVRVISKDLKVLEGLQASDFVLKENGVPQKICAFVRDRQPISVGILLDTSASMRGSKINLLAVVKAGISQFLDASRPDDEYFLEYVNTGPAMKCTFSCDLSHIRAGLETKPKGRTALIDAIYLALHAMHNAHNVNQSLLVFSDGDDNSSIYNSKELSEVLDDSPIPIFLIIPEERWGQGPRTSGEEFARKDLVRLTNQSGGYAITVWNKREMMTASTQVASAIRAPYMLYFVSPWARSTRFRELHIEVTGVRPRPWVYYRAIYYPQGQKQAQ